MARRSAIAAIVILAAVSILLLCFLRSARPELPAPAASDASIVAQESKPGSVAMQAPESPGERMSEIEASPPKEVPVSAAAVTGTDRAALRLFGSVLLSDGHPFDQPETVLVLTDSSGRDRRATIESGKYAFDGLEAGPYVLGSRKPGFKHLALNVVLDEKRPSQELDLTIERAWTIDVHLVTPEGEDLRARLRKEKLGIFVQPTICCTLEPPGDRLEPTSLLDHSRDGLSLPASDPTWEESASNRIYVQAEPPIHVNVLLRDFVLATRRVEIPETDLTFVISVEQIRAILSGLTVRLVDGETGLPATAAGVNLLTDSTSESFVHPDEQGRVQYQGRLPGLYELHAYLKGFAFEVRNVDLPPGVTTDLGTITFGKGLSVSGRCVDESGAPKRVPMMLTPLADPKLPGREPSMTNFIVKADPDGNFTVRNLPRSRFCLRVTSAPAVPMQEGESGWSARPVLVDTNLGQVDDLVVVVGRPLHVVLHPTGPGVLGMKYEIVTADGLVATDGEFAQMSSVSLDLVKGDYTVHLSRGTNRIRELPLLISLETTTVEIDP